MTTGSIMHRIAQKQHNATVTNCMHAQLFSKKFKLATHLNLKRFYCLLPSNMLLYSLEGILVSCPLTTRGSSSWSVNSLETINVVIVFSLYDFFCFILQQYVLKFSKQIRGMNSFLKYMKMLCTSQGECEGILPCTTRSWMSNAVGMAHNTR